MAIISEFQRKNFSYAYLRNFEELPTRIGNDVDLLVTPGQRPAALLLIQNTVQKIGWSVYQIIEFGPLSVYMCSPARDKFLHIDLFDRIEWHWIPFADTHEILQKSKWNGYVYHLDERDELFLNIMTRLGYSGIVREKHKLQSSFLFSLHENNYLADTWKRNLGKHIGNSCVNMIKSGEWNHLLQYWKKNHIVLKCLLIARRPASSFAGFFRYLKRAIARILSPPGPVITWNNESISLGEKVAQGITPLLLNVTGREDIQISQLASASTTPKNISLSLRVLFEIKISSIKNKAVIILNPLPKNLLINLFLKKYIILDPYKLININKQTTDEKVLDNLDDELIQSAQSHLAEILCKNYLPPLDNKS